MDMERKNYRKITVADLAPHVHRFLPNENKVQKLFFWLKEWIVLSLECRKIQPYDLLPSKGDLACHIGVSQGTMQSVFRLLEDAGLVESKQRIGTYIKDRASSKELKKLTSKRELAVEIVKKYLHENGYKVGDVVISSRKLSAITGVSNTTLRSAFINLTNNGILIKKDNKFYLSDSAFEVNKVELKTLAEKISDSIKKYIEENLKEGDRIPSNSILSKKFNVSVKTIHDAIKILIKSGNLYSRRGQYGTIVVTSGDVKQVDSEYFYEKIEQKIRYYISSKCQIGDKLPTISGFAKEFATSTKTIKRALDNLSEEGFVAFSRGRYGGTFVLDIPQDSSEAYRWLAISSDYISN